jgi:hypothetical protein
VGVGEEEAAQVVLQGGLRAILVAMDINTDVKMVRVVGIAFERSQKAMCIEH